jgi:inhibitor of cysteine peptidase
MKSRVVLMCLMTISLFTLPACLSTGPRSLTLDIASSGKEVTMAVGGALTLTLQSNITTGYSWNETANISDNTLLQQTGHEYRPPANPMPGAGGAEVWTFKALKAGTATVSMDYARPFEPTAPPANTFNITVVVQ